MNPALETINRRILVVDDNPAIIDDFRKILCSEPDSDGALRDAEAALFGDGDGGSTEAARPVFQIDAASQGEQGYALVELAQKNRLPYAVAFIDMRMPPGWDGIETISHIWEKDPRLQIVVCTAYSDYSWKEMSARLDLGDRLLILKKPFDNIEAYQLACALTAKWEMTQQAELKMGRLEEAVSERTLALSRANEALQAEIAERKLLGRQLEQLSVTDPLTGLANRRRFDDTLAAEWARAQRSGRPIGLVMLDIDHFKRYNDHYGHIGGDACLRRVAAALAGVVCDGTALAARYGGEEFALILPDADSAAVFDLAQRACNAVAALHEPHAAAEGGCVTISAGIASMPPSADAAAEQLVALADIALYEAKRAGRNRVMGQNAGELQRSL